jgi:hypothetical protein
MVHQNIHLQTRFLTGRHQKVPYFEAPYLLVQLGWRLAVSPVWLVAAPALA